MPVRIYYNNQQEFPCTIRPTPLVSIATNILKNGAGESFGVTYSITLTGSLLADQGTPYGFKHDNVTKYPFFGVPSPSPAFVGPYNAFDNNISHAENGRPPKQMVNTLESSQSIFSKQKALRALFARDGQLLEITDFSTDLPSILCYPRVLNIDFTEGTYVDRCDFTITLEADILLNQNNLVDREGTLYSRENILDLQGQVNEQQLINDYNAAFINDYSEDWSIEVDDTVGESSDVPRSYRISHSINATGKTHHTATGVEPAWLQAKKFVLNKLSPGGTGIGYPNIMGQIGSGTIDLISAYGGYNHIRTEQLSESNGTYSITENWFLASGTAYENYNMSISSSIDAPFVSVSIDGNIKGLNSKPPNGFGGQYSGSGVSAYQNALNKYNQISNTGSFGLTSDFYKRANNTVAVQLNSQPRSIALGVNQYNGEITYNLQFDNRPTNIISGVLAESISVNDTYPGDIFAIIPVIGRQTGPVLQYIGGRTEYKRDISINLVLDYTRIPYGTGRSTLLLQKPSVVEPIASQLSNLIQELSPAREPGIRKYFVSPPTESWNPKEGTYSFNLSWTYELDK